MELDVDAVRAIFCDVLAGRMSREAADRWALSMLQRDEAGMLSYSPVADKERICAGIIYLYGIDVQDAPGNYLHSDSDICNAMASMVGGSDDFVARRKGLAP